MTTCLGKSCSFGLPRVPFVNCCQCIYLVISPFGFVGKIWDLFVLVPGHCLSFYFSIKAGSSPICSEFGIRCKIPLKLTQKSQSKSHYDILDKEATFACLAPKFELCPFITECSSPSLDCAICF